VETKTIIREHGRKAPKSEEPISDYFALKFWPTRIIGVILLILATPAILILVAIVRCTSVGPGLYRQSRTGKNGSEFQMYKVRTMYQNAESVTGPTWCVKGDSRITPVGKIFRLLHLDELPQLINVVRGEMDLIGPRPERPEFVSWLSRDVPHYTERLRVLPGVTGLAQINLPPDETVDCVRKKLQLDRQYMHRASFSMDVRILLCTFLRMVGIRQGRAARWLGVRYLVDVAEFSPSGESTTPHSALHRPDTAGRHDTEDIYVGNVVGPTAMTSRERRAAAEAKSAANDEIAVSAVAAPRWPR
jgi:lipopolysaccharide/colanic/teichoic acid biosynthesis glycosyltransferase